MPTCRTLAWIALTALAATGCSMCGAEPAEVSGSPSPAAPPEGPEAPAPEPDPCPGAEEALAGFAEASPLPVEALPQGSGGEPIAAESLRLSVADDVRWGETVLGPTIEAAVEALATREPPEAGAPVLLYLRADDPVARVAPLLRALPETSELGLVVVETAHGHPECRSARQIPFGLRRGDEHGWVVFPTARTVRELVIALGGADPPRRVQLAL